MGSGNCGSCAPGVGVYWKKNCICKWTHAVQTCVVQGSTVFSITNFPQFRSSNIPCVLMFSFSFSFVYFKNSLKVCMFDSWIRNLLFFSHVPYSIYFHSWFLLYLQQCGLLTVIIFALFLLKLLPWSLHSLPELNFYIYGFKLYY